MEGMMSCFRKLIAVVVILAFVALATSAAMAVEKGTGFGACHVVAGPNEGKSGKYEKDGSCCGEEPNYWGCTVCDGSNTGKCKDGAAAQTGPGE
jgi:hypothetical protein